MYIYIYIASRPLLPYLNVLVSSRNHYDCGLYLLYLTYLPSHCKSPCSLHTCAPL